MLLLLGLVVYLGLAALLFIEPASRGADASQRGSSGTHANLLRAPHGRAAALLMLLRFGVAVLYASAFLSYGSPWAVAGINIVLGCSWLAAVLWLLPFEVQWLNRLQAAYGETRLGRAE